MPFTSEPYKVFIGDDARVTKYKKQNKSTGSLVEINFPKSTAQTTK